MIVDMKTMANEPSPIDSQTAERVLEELLRQFRDKLPEGYRLDERGRVVRLDPDLPNRVRIRSAAGNPQWIPAPLINRRPDLPIPVISHQTKVDAAKSA